MHKLDGGALKGGRHEYGEQISCHPKASAHAVSVLPRFGKYLSVFIGGGESYETKRQRGYILDIAGVRKLQVRKHVPSLPAWAWDAFRNSEHMIDDCSRQIRVFPAAQRI